jgi:hypothetical protein
MPALKPFPVRNDRIPRVVTFDTLLPWLLVTGGIFLLGLGA